MSQKVGAEGVQLYAKGELDPATITPEDVKAVRPHGAGLRSDDYGAMRANWAVTVCAAPRKIQTSWSI